jgi:hypothetical protein
MSTVAVGAVEARASGNEPARLSALAHLPPKDTQGVISSGLAC